MSEEPITCIPFTGVECIYRNCPAFNRKLDECGLSTLVRVLNSILEQPIATIKAVPEKRIEDRTEKTELHPLMPLKPFPVFEVKKYIPKMSGEIIDIPTIKEVETRSGPSQVANFMLSDGKDQVRIALWGDLVDAIKPYNKGDRLTLSGMATKEPYDGVTQISSTRNTKISRGAD